MKENNKPVVFIIPQGENYFGGIGFLTVTKAYFDKHGCVSEGGFENDLQYTLGIPKKEIKKMISTLERLGFSEEAENDWIIDEEFGEEILEKFDNDLIKIFDFLNNNNDFPVTFEVANKKIKGFNDEDDE